MQRPPVILLFKGTVFLAWGLSLLFGTLLFHTHHLALHELPHLIRTDLRHAGAWGPLVFLLISLLAAIIPLPTSALGIAAGAVYGRFWGGALIWFGLQLSGSTSFFLGRVFGRHFVADMEHTLRWVKRYDDALAEEGFITVLLLRLFYVPFELVSLVCGLSRLSYREFFWATFLGALPSVFALVSLGNALDHRPKTLLPSIFVLAAVVGAAIFAYRTPSIRRRLKGRAGTQE